MKRIKNIVLVLFSALSIVSCSDTWDEHYDNKNKVDFSLIDYINSHDELSDFAQLVKATGYDKELDERSGQNFTLWAPVNGSFDKNEYLDMISAGKKDEVIKRFINNHISRTGISYSSLDDVINVRMLNAKRFSMTSDGNIENSMMLVQNVKCSNGILYEIDNSLPFQPNLYEKIELEHNAWLNNNPEEKEKGDLLISLFTFLSKYNSDSLDIEHSVGRDFDENGNKIYVDSVLIRNNTILAGLDALIYDEDSSYTAIIPSVSAFQKRYHEAENYLNYNPYLDTQNKIELCDSLKKYFATSFAMTDLFYNMNVNKAPQDSVVSTIYDPYVNWENHVYHNPFGEGGIFSGYKEKCDCSNGTAYIFDEYPLSVTDQFFKKNDIKCVDLTNISNETSFSKNLVTDYNRYSVSYVNKETSEVTTTQLVVIEPSKSSNSPYVGINIKNNLSATYDIYLEYSPNWVLTYGNYETAKNSAMQDSLAYAEGDNSKQAWKTPILTTPFRAFIYERDDAGKYPSSSKSVELKPTSGTNHVTRVTNEIDTLYLGSYTFKHAYYDSNSESQVMPIGAVLQLQVNVSTKEFTNYLYSRNLLLSKVILVPRVEDKESVKILTAKQR